MQCYAEKNYSYQIFANEKHQDWLANSHIIGIVTNNDDESFGIPLLIRKESIGKGSLPLPNLTCKSTLAIFDTDSHKTCPFVIFMDSNDLVNLQNGDLNTEVALYHEIGHFHYNDEADPTRDMTFKSQEIRNGRLMKEEAQADEFAVKILGVDRVIIALEEIYKISKLYQIKEQETEACLRISAIKKATPYENE